MMAKCDKAPKGWECSRAAGHDGSCAAKPLKLSDDEAKAMLETLSMHFGEPVKPVGEYCAALLVWASALRMKAERLEKEPLRTTAAMNEAVRASEFAYKVAEVFAQISKSNLLARLIYEGESLRTEMCPVHKGIWSGCHWAEKDDGNCKCQSSQDGHIGSNVTGWLP